jgi:hypothetical protein
MSPRSRLFAVLVGFGLVSSAGAAERTPSAVGPSVFSAVQSQKAVGPSVFSAVQSQKAVGPSVFSAVRTQKDVGATSASKPSATPLRKKSGGKVLDLNAGF